MKTRLKSSMLVSSSTSSVSCPFLFADAKWVKQLLIGTFESHSSLEKRWLLSSSLAFVISADTWLGCVFKAVFSPSWNFAFNYVLTSAVKHVATCGFEVVLPWLRFEGVPSVTSVGHLLLMTLKVFASTGLTVAKRWAQSLQQQCTTPCHSLSL